MSLRLLVLAPAAILLLAILAGIVWLIVNPKTRVAGIVLVVVGPLVLVGLWTVARFRLQPPARVATVELPSPNPPTKIAVPAPPARERTAPGSPVPAPVLETRAPETLSTQASRIAWTMIRAAVLAMKSPPEAAKSDVPPQPERPAWVDSPPKCAGDAYQITKAIGPYTTRQECEARLPDALHEAVDQYVMACLGEANSGGAVRLPVDYLRQHVVKEQWEETRAYSVGPMVELHLLLRFDRSVKERILDQQRRALVAGRLTTTGEVALGVLGLLATVYAYLKFTAVRRDDTCPT